MYQHEKEKQIKLNQEETKYYLYNILTDELLQITCQLNILEEILNILIENKYNNKNKITNEKFIQNNLIIKNKYMELNNKIKDIILSHEKMLENVINVELRNIIQKCKKTNITEILEKIKNMGYVKTK
jgi:hypothetical protein